MTQDVPPFEEWMTRNGKKMTGRRCQAHRSVARGGGQCDRRAAEGGRVCKMHGGAAPQVRHTSATRTVEENARAMLQRHRTLTESPIVDPLEELARLAGEVLAFKDYLRAQVDALEETLTYWTVTAGDDAEAMPQAVENVRAIVAAYERALDRSTKVLATMVKLDLQGRLVAIREEQATQVVGAIREGLFEVDLEPAVRAGVEAAIAEKLEALATPRALPA